MQEIAEEEGTGKKFFDFLEEIKVKAVIEKDKTPKRYVDFDVKISSSRRSINVFLP